jgi:hypothetical protein
MTGKKLNASSIIRLNSAVTDSAAPGFGLHHFLITNRFSGEDNPSIFGIAYNTTGMPANGNISGSTEFHGEVFEINPERFSLATSGAPINTVNPHGYQRDYILNGNFLQVNNVASITWRTPTEELPDKRAPAVGVIKRFIGAVDRATTTSLLEQPAFADRPF